MTLVLGCDSWSDAIANFVDLTPTCPPKYVDSLLLLRPIKWLNSIREQEEIIEKRRIEERRTNVSKERDGGDEQKLSKSKDRKDEKRSTKTRDEQKLSKAEDKRDEKKSSNSKEKRDEKSSNSKKKRDEKSSKSKDKRDEKSKKPKVSKKTIDSDSDDTKDVLSNFQFDEEDGIDLAPRKPTIIEEPPSKRDLLAEIEHSVDLGVECVEDKEDDEIIVDMSEEDGTEDEEDEDGEQVEDLSLIREERNDLLDSRRPKRRRVQVERYMDEDFLDLMLDGQSKSSLRRVFAPVKKHAFFDRGDQDASEEDEEEEVKLQREQEMYEKKSRKKLQKKSSRKD